MQMHSQCLSSDGIAEDSGCRSDRWGLRDPVQPLVCGSCHSASPESRGVKSEGFTRTSQLSTCAKEEFQLLVGEREAVNHRGHFDDDFMHL